MPHKDPDARRAYQREYQRKWNQEHPEERREIMRASDSKRQGTPHRRAQSAETRRRRHLRVKVRVLIRYGGCCAFCGDARLEVLQIDHVNGDGKAHRATIKRYRGIYDYLDRTPFRPKVYRVLCANCHHAWTHYGVSPDGNPYKTIDQWRTESAQRNKRGMT